MKQQKLDTRFRVVRKLQDLISKLDPTSYEYEVYDKAYELALNDGRKVNSYFLKNLLSDAKHILKRQKNTSPQFYSLEAIQESGKDYIPDTRPQNYNSGELKVIAEQTIDQFNAICAGIHNKASAVLTCMEQDLDIKETAERTKLSVSLVKRIRVKIKETLRNKLV